MNLPSGTVFLRRRQFSDTLLGAGFSQCQANF